MLSSWRARLAKDGVGVELAFLSVDADAPTVTKFRETHPQTPEGPRIRDVELLAGWLGTLGLDESSVLPIHLFVDPQDKLRCVRMGGVGEDDYDTVKRVLGQGRS